MTTLAELRDPRNGREVGARYLSVGTERFGWTFHKDAWHRPDPGSLRTAMCGLHLPQRVRTVPAQEAAREIAENHTSVCGSCERWVTAAVKGGQPPDRSVRTASGLSNDKEALKRQRQQERVRRQELRRGEARDQQDRSRNQGSSVRTVSGGLPSLGKRR